MPELEHEFIVAHGAVGPKPFTHKGKIHGAGALMNLHRIAPAESDMGPALACQMHKVAPAAGAAVRVGLSRLNGRSPVGPEVPGKQGAAQLFARFPGDWTVRQQLSNPAATTFWRKAISYPYRETVENSEVVQRFTVCVPPGETRG